VGATPVAMGARWYAPLVFVQGIDARGGDFAFSEEIGPRALRSAMMAPGGDCGRQIQPDGSRGSTESDVARTCGTS
jgi:hypothetical protein